MLFDSLDFVNFCTIVFIIYWIIGTKRVGMQNLFLWMASYFFYGWWDWRFLNLIFFSTILDFSIGLLLDKTSSNLLRKGLLFISIFCNIGLLCFFKYYNFFIDNFTKFITFFGAEFDPLFLYIILPVGMSFYTLQTLSYTIDIYRKKIKPTKDFIAFSAFVCFFPQLVAGPIERAKSLLPQFLTPRKFDLQLATNGMRQILWGMFKKMVVADNCAMQVNYIFDNYQDQNSLTLLLGAVLFSFQIYGDFSGYSDIAIGTGKLFGFELRKNFAYPYFSRNVGEFWRRWHISLTTWFRDYLYIPLGGSRKNLVRTLINVIIVFGISGLWHGANFTFIAWGLINAALFIPLLILNQNRRYLEIIDFSPNLKFITELGQILTTFFLISITWIFFRSPNLKTARAYLDILFDFNFSPETYLIPLSTVIPILILLIFEWLNRERPYPLWNLEKKANPVFRKLIYVCLLLMIVLISGEGEVFLYFQF